MNIHTFAKRKQQGQKISMVTCYDHWSARILNDSEVDCLLVGDSLAMVMHGFDSTVHATVEMMATHTAAVARGAPDKFIIADMPFLSCSRGIDKGLDAVQALMSAGANAVKIEGDTHQIELIQRLVETGVPVMGHIGLTPQSVHGLGGHRIQGKGEEEAQRLVNGASALESAGCFAIVIECVPHVVGRCISRKVNVPTIGIGAGPDTDGQVLVLHDLLGVQPDFTPKFLRRYANSYSNISEAVNHFHHDVVEQQFPSLEESYG
ncbi:MAG: 3-methyl-2-oxobutanoate hydroxymethyltransferase [Pseudomonadales bacterium]|nr:3-methyl-2-oxobutanoate hydroxymethyltransferase [Pseudomonadales bacterium]